MIKERNRKKFLASKPQSDKTRTVSTPFVRHTTSHCESASKPLPCRPLTLPTWAHFQASRTLSCGRGVAISLAATEVFPLVHCKLLAQHTDVSMYVDQSCFVCAGRVVQLHKHVFPIVDRRLLRPLPTPYFLLFFRDDPILSILLMINNRIINRIVGYTTINP